MLKQEKYKRINIRLLPTKEQEVKMWKSVNNVRNVKNIFIARCYEIDKDTEFFSVDPLKKELTKLLKDKKYMYLKETSRQTLNFAIKDVVDSFINYRRKSTKKPVFKKKTTATKSFKVRNGSNSFRRVGFTFYLEKIGNIKFSKKYYLKNKYIFDYMEKDRYILPTVIYDGKYWFISIMYRSDLINSQKPRELTNETIGIDLGIKTLATCSNGKSYKNINKSQKVKKIEKKLKRKQRQVSRKYEMNKQDKKFIKTNNIIKLEKEIKLLHRKLKNIRNTHIHTMTKEIVEQLPQEIVIEDLKVSNMMKNKHLSKHISKSNWHEIRRQLSYKCEDRGILLTVANTYYPSSQTCSCCGNRLTKQDKLSLSQRTFTCECGTTIDRDLNASYNLRDYRYSKWYQNHLDKQTKSSK